MTISPPVNIRLLGQLPFTALVMVLSLTAFLLLFTHDLSAIAKWFMPDNPSELWAATAFWRIWTPIFIHYTIFHLLTNLCLWWLFAAQIELASRAELIVLTLLAAAVSNACQYLAAGAQFGGLSGVVYALLGYLGGEYYFAKTPRFRLDPILAILMLVMLPLAATGQLGKYANYAHLAGLLTGIAAVGVRLALLQQLTFQRIRFARRAP